MLEAEVASERASTVSSGMTCRARNVGRTGRMQKQSVIFKITSEQRITRNAQVMSANSRAIFLEEL